MFAQVPLEALSDHRLSLIDTRVLGALFSFGSLDKPVVWPRRKTIASRCGDYCPETISRAISRLTRFGWITRIQRRRDFNIYTLRVPGVTDPVTSRHDRSGHTEQTIGTDQLFSLRERELTETEPEIALEQPSAPAETLPLTIPLLAVEEALEDQPERDIPEASASIEIIASIESAPAPTTAPEPETAPQADSDALEQAKAIIVALIAASGARYSTDAKSQPMRAAERALAAGYTVEQLKMVIAWCASTWSNPKFLTPSAVLRIDRLDERVAAAQAAAPAGTRQQAHKLFERDKPIERAKPETVSKHLGSLKAALRGQMTA